jgi:TolB-like protein
MALAALVAAGLAPRPARAAPAVTVAVSYFDNTSGQAELEPLRKGFADMLITDLAAADDLVLVERARLEAALRELRLQKSPYIAGGSGLPSRRAKRAAYRR